jgi:hypothetical protein
MADEDEMMVRREVKKVQKLNSRQLLFARLVGEGKSRREAYRRAYGKDHPHGAAVVSRHPEVKAEIERRRDEAEAASVLKRDEVLELLSTIILTPVGDLDVNHPLVQEYTLTRRGETETLKVKALPKLDAIKLLAHMCGWMKPEECGEPLTVILKKMW